MDLFIPFIVIIVVLLIVAIYFIYSYQLFTRVTLQPSIVGPLHGFCIEVTGSYHSIGAPIEANEKTIQTIAPNVWKTVQYCMVLYHDIINENTAANECRARVCWCISVPLSSLESLEEYKSLMKSIGGYSFSLPSTPSLTWQYPYKSFLSFIIGHYKFYPSLNKYHPDLLKKAAEAGLQGSLEFYRLEANPPHICYAVPTVIDRTHAAIVPLFRPYQITNKKAQ